MEKIKLTVAAKQRVDIVFENVSFSVKTKGGTKDIVKSASGKFKSGELTAIMGPSGAGKTSLLNILTGYQLEGTKGTIKCTLRGSNKKRGALQYKKNSCYILQDDHLADYFTVEEIMKSTVRLKRANLLDKSVEYLIEDILSTLSLSSAKHTRCANLSGGQKKRLSIALELIDDPPIMFLDEPTTGLDSSSTTQCIYMLKNLAQQGRTIICTVHQPSAPLYAAFDHVYAMAEGRCIYQGASENTIMFLGSLGFQCPQYHNPADYLIEVASEEHGECIELLSKAASDMKWRNSINLEKQLTELDDGLDVITDDAVYYAETKELNNKQRPSEWTRFWILLHRQFLFLYRDWTVSQLKVLMHLLVGIFLGVNFQNCGDNGSKVVTNMSFLMIGVVYLVYTAVMPAALRFPSEMEIIRKEHFNNWYKLKTYYTAFLVADLPLQALYAIVYTISSYFISSQPPELNRFLMVLLLQILVGLVASSMGLVFGTLLNPINGTFIGAITTCFFFSVAGFLLFFPHMSYAMYMVTYLSYMSFAMEGLVQALYGFGRKALPCPEEIDYCLYSNTKDLLEDLGMAKQNYWNDILYLIGSVFLFRFLAYFTLKRRLMKTT